MNVSALLTSAGINTAICVLFLSLYSILRKQTSYRSVYFGQKLASLRSGDENPLWYERFVPSPSWILKAWETSEEEILSIGGLDAVVFCRLLVFSIRIFSIAAISCLLLVLPVNYYGKVHHKKLHSESLDAFSIGNVKEGSKWLLVHCLALYIISCSACILLYFEYKSLSRMRLAHITISSANTSYFTVLVRAIPWSSGESYSDSVRKYFTKYHPASYLSHQMVYRCGTLQQLMNEAENVCKKIAEMKYRQKSVHCGSCEGTEQSLEVLASESASVERNCSSHELDLLTTGKVCATAFVFFKTRFAAVVASNIIQSSNPMLWVTDLAPEASDVYWSNLWIPYRQLWIRKIATFLAVIVSVVLFMAPVTLVQGMVQLDELENKFQLQGILKAPFMRQLVTGYLPSVILILFLYIVPPIMMIFSALEGPISHSGRKKSACVKVLYFTMWNVFFLNCLFGSAFEILQQFERPKEVLRNLSEAVPRQASFFITYVLTSGWASLSCEIMQPFLLMVKLFRKFIGRTEGYSSDSILSFPYHTEVPRVLLLGLFGFTFSTMSPLILPFLVIYFLLAYLVYKNQFLNVYSATYESGGQYWPVAYNAIIFSLVLTQLLAVGVFGLKDSPIALGFTIVLVIGTLLFHVYCRERFYPIFKSIAAEVFIEMDQQDEQNGRFEQIYDQVSSTYSHFLITNQKRRNAKTRSYPKDEHPIPDPEDMKPDEEETEKELIQVKIQCPPEREKPEDMKPDEEETEKELIQVKIPCPPEREKPEEGDVIGACYFG